MATSASSAAISLLRNVRELDELKIHTDINIAILSNIDLLLNLEDEKRQNFEEIVRQITIKVTVTGIVVCK